MFDECLHKIPQVKFFQVITTTFSTVLNPERQLQCNHYLKQESEVEKKREKRSGSSHPHFCRFFYPYHKFVNVRHLSLYGAAIRKRFYCGICSNLFTTVKFHRVEFQCFQSQSFLSHVIRSLHRVHLQRCYIRNDFNLNANALFLEVFIAKILLNI